MDLKPVYAVAEDAIQTLGVNPEETRCEDEGQWILERENVEIYIDIWQPQEHNQWEYFKEDEPTAIFQVVAPVCFIPEDKELLHQFMEELLYINHHMFYGSFTVNTQEGMAAIRFKRLVEGANRVEMIEPIESIGFYAENLAEYMSKKYGVKKIEKNQ
jgi:hypothetical protein